MLVNGKPCFSGLERYSPLVEDWPGFVRSLGEPLKGCVWANSLRISPQDFARVLIADGLDPRPLPWSSGAFSLPPDTKVGNRWWYLAGLGHSQEEASLLPAILLDSRSGHRVLDLCAAPGGKTAQIALALNGCGTVVANEVVPGRVRALRANLERLGLLNVSVTRHDGSNYPGAAGRFQRVLVDAPCSGEGTLRKQPGAGRVGHIDREKISRRQRALLRRAAALCAPGGRLVYSTCTFAPEENELIVASVLDEYAGGLHLIPSLVADFPTSPGLTEWQGRALDSSLRHAHRLWPHIQNTGGFFVAVLEKAGGTATAEPHISALTQISAPELDSALHERFGIDSRSLGDAVVHKRSGRSLYCASLDHRPPAAPEPEVIGMGLVRHRMRPPKLSTAGAMLLGICATRNCVDLQQDQVEPYLRREDLVLSDLQSARCTGSGYVIARYWGHGLGMAYYDSDRRLVSSLFPKRWLGWSS